MFQVSNFKKIVIFAMMAVFVFTSVLLTESEPAEATPSTAVTRSVNPFPLGVLGIKESTPTQPSGVLAANGGTAQSVYKTDVWSWLNEAACDAAPVVGMALSATTGVCDDTVVGSVVESVEEAIDCATNIPQCITDWIYGVVGAGVAWVAAGIVTLVTSTPKECEVPDGSGRWATVSGDCGRRIHEDYFAGVIGREKQLSEVIFRSYSDQRREITAEMRQLRTSGQRGTARYQELQRQLRDLDTTNGANDQANPIASAQDLRNQNRVFDVPKSAISSQTWQREYGKYVLLAVSLLVPMIIAACLQALISGKGHLIMRAVVINMPLAIFAMIIAPWVTRRLMGITDEFSAFIISDVQNDVENFFMIVDPQQQAGMGMALLLGFSLVALIFIFAALLIWFVLSLREASVALIAVFLPIAFAASVWPALSKWAIRAIKLLVAAIISKVFIVGAISLGLGTFTGATQTGHVSISHLIFGSTIFFVAAFSPHLVMKFFDEIGDALNAAGGTGAIGRGLNAAANANGTRNIVGQQGLAGIIKGKMGLGDSGGGMGGPGGGGPDPGLSQIAAGIASLKPGATPSSTGAAADRTAEKQGFGASGRAHAASMGAEEGPGATGLDKLQAAQDASIRATSGSTGSAEGDAIAAGNAMTQAAMDNGVSQPEAIAMGQSAASQALGGTPPAHVSGAIAAHGAGITKAAAKVKEAKIVGTLLEALQKA